MQPWMRVFLAFVVGGLVGILVACLCVIAGQNARREEEQYRNETQ